MSDTYEDLYREIDGETCLMNPADGQYHPIIDEREKFSSSGKDGLKSPGESAFEEAFEKRRGIGTRKGISKEGEDPKSRVGYGSIFQEDYKAAYRSGTVIAMDIICPQRVGGDVNTWLYLTETNRTAKGVEALVYYEGQSELAFKVYDWAQEDGNRWQVTMTAHDLRDYFAYKPFEGKRRQTLNLQNMTYMVGKYPSERWTNRVYLYNYRLKRHSLIYSCEYDATEEMQNGDPEVGFWGPIVEIFQNKSSKTDLIGFSNTYMKERDEQNSWSRFHLLTADISESRNDHAGFNVVFEHPHHSFAVN